MNSKRVIVWFFYTILFFLLIAAAVLIFPMQKQLSADSAELARQQKIEQERRAVSNDLSAEVNALQSSPDAVEKVAREKFNLCREGETVMHYQDNE